MLISTKHNWPAEWWGVYTCHWLLSITNFHPYQVNLNTAKLPNEVKKKNKTIQIYLFDFRFGLGSFNCELEPTNECALLCGGKNHKQTHSFAHTHTNHGAFAVICMRGHCNECIDKCVFVLFERQNCSRTRTLQMVCDDTYLDAFTMKTNENRSVDSWVIRHPFVVSTTKMHPSIVARWRKCN